MNAVKLESVGGKGHDRSNRAGNTGPDQGAVKQTSCQATERQTRCKCRDERERPADLPARAVVLNLEARGEQDPVNPI